MQNQNIQVWKWIKKGVIMENILVLLICSIFGVVVYLFNIRNVEKFDKYNLLTVFGIFLLGPIGLYFVIIATFVSLFNNINKEIKNPFYKNK